MEKIQNPADTIYPEMPLLYPNPAGSYIRAVLPEDILGMVNIRVFNQKGIKILEESRMIFYGDPYELDLTNMVPGIYIVIFTNPGNGRSYKSRFIIAGGL